MKKLKSTLCLAAVCLFSALTPVSASSAYNAVSARIPVSALGKADVSPAYTYTIRIEAETENAPEPLNDTIEMSEPGTDFFEINITEPGTFNYRIYEAAGDDQNIRYDDKVYTVSVFVENHGDNELRYAVVAYTGENDTKTDEISFENTALIRCRDKTDDTPDHEMTESSSETTHPPDSDTETTSAEPSSAETSTVTTSSVPPADSDNGSLSEFVTTVLTGDTFPAHALRVTMLTAALTAAAALLLKRRDREE